MIDTRTRTRNGSRTRPRPVALTATGLRHEGPLLAAHVHCTHYPGVTVCQCRNLAATRNGRIIACCHSHSAFCILHSTSILFRPRIGSHSSIYILSSPPSFCFRAIPRLSCVFSSVRPLDSLQRLRNPFATLHLRQTARRPLGILSCRWLAHSCHTSVTSTASHSPARIIPLSFRVPVAHQAGYNRCSLAGPP